MDLNPFPAIMRFIGRSGKRIAVTVLGVMVLLIGVFLSLPLVPGPGIVVILIGLTILASEWAWAERALDRAKQSGKVVVEQATASPLRIVLSVLVTLGGIAAAVWFFFLR